MQYNPENPLVVQSDMTILLEVNSPLYEEVRDAIAPFAEIIKTPEHIHSYRISPISLWNAASAGLQPDEVIYRLVTYSRFEVSQNLIVEIKELMSRYGKVKIENYDEFFLKITTEDVLLMDQFLHTDSIAVNISKRLDQNSSLIEIINRGLIKQALIKKGYPALDLAGYAFGKHQPISLQNDKFTLRPYQTMAKDAFYKGGSSLGGSGVIVLPCGAGKTIVGMAAMSAIQNQTLILTTSITAIRQWKREILDKTSLREDMVGEYSGEVKEIRPVTISTYQMLTHKNRESEDFIHFQLLNDHPWGLLIYDEVHLLPAQVFRFTASLQAIRRLGLTATLIREDGRETDVFSLIGPKCFDVPWKVIEKQGWIAEAQCCEIRIPIDDETKMQYVVSDARKKFRIASENPQKDSIIPYLLSIHKTENILIIGQYIDQVKRIAKTLNIPIITGKTANKKRDLLYEQFRQGQIKTLVVSSVGNFAIDLPDASVAIQVSGKFGSRQEEAQRLGRILRPKSNGNQARFYTLVTSETEEQEFALNRQLFLTEQGYNYNIITDKELDTLLETPNLKIVNSSPLLTDK